MVAALARGPGVEACWAAASSGGDVLGLTLRGDRDDSGPFELTGNTAALATRRGK